MTYKEILKLEEDSKGHAEFSPSAFKRIMNCATSVFLSRDLPERKRGPSSKDGTTWHSVCELYVPAKLNGEKYPKILDPKVTSEMKLHARDAAEYCYDQVKHLLGMKHIWFVEDRMHLDKERDIWGSPDFVFIWKSGMDKSFHLILVDFKYGTEIEVESIDNWQLELYILCIAQEMKEKGIELKTATGHIFQPRTDHETPPAKYDVKELQEKKLPSIFKQVDMIRGWVKEGRIPTDAFEEHQNVGSWCQFCKAQGVCKAYKSVHVGKTLSLLKKATKAVGEEKKDYTNMPVLLEKGIVSLEDLEYMALNAAKIANFAKASIPILMTMAAKGVKLQETKIVESGGKRSLIQDTDKLLRILLKCGLKKEEIVWEEKKWITMTAAEKQLKSRKKLKALKQIIVPGAPNYKIVPKSHKSPAVKFGLDTLAMLKSDYEKEEE